MNGNSVIVIMSYLGAILIALGMFIASRHMAASRKAKAELTSSDTYRNLAGEYQGLAEMAITAQEHTDLKLADVTSQLSLLREELKAVQRILQEVE